MDTDSFEISLADVEVNSEYISLSYLEIPDKSNNKTPERFENEFGS